MHPYGEILPELKAEFAGLPTKGWHLTHEGIYFDEDNPYFGHGYYFDLSSLPQGTLAAQQARDFSSALVENCGMRCSSTLNITHAEFYYAYNQDRQVSCPFLKEDSHPNAKKINAQVMEYLDQYYTYDAIHAEFAAQTTADFDLWSFDWFAYCYADRYIMFRGSTPECYLGDDNWLHYSKEAYLLFDLDSGEQVDTAALLKDGWQDAVTEVSPPYGVSELFPDIEAATRIEIVPSSYDELILIVRDAHGAWWLHLPISYLSIS